MAYYPPLLMDLAELAHAARIAGHSEADIARAAGFPDLTPHRSCRAAPSDTHLAASSEPYSRSEPTANPVPPRVPDVRPGAGRQPQ